jgi:hypothetical protein
MLQRPPRTSQPNVVGRTNEAQTDDDEALKPGSVVLP